MNTAPARHDLHAAFHGAEIPANGGGCVDVMDQIDSEFAPLRNVQGWGGIVACTRALFRREN